MHSRYVFRGLALRWAVRNANCIIAVSEPLRSFAVQCGARPELTITIPNGVDTGVYHPYLPSDVLHRFGIPEDAPLIASVGYLIERKGHHGPDASFGR